MNKYQGADFDDFLKEEKSHRVSKTNLHKVQIYKALTILKLLLATNIKNIMRKVYNDKS